MHRIISNIVVCTFVFTSVGCGGGEQVDAESNDAPDVSTQSSATVQIISPEEGATVGTDVTVTLQTSGIEIVSITPPVPGTGHHHLYVDVDLTPLNEMVPQGNPQIIHQGDGSTERTIEGLAPGPHRIIAVVANPAHIPIDPPVIDTVHFCSGGNC
jgi:hypothetical protein